MAKTEITAKESICVGDVVDVYAVDGEVTEQWKPVQYFKFGRVTRVGMHGDELVAWVQFQNRQPTVISQKHLIPRHWVECKKCFGEGMDDNKDPGEPRRCYECGGEKGEWVL